MPRLGLLADFAAVATGGAVGALLRYGLTAAMPLLFGGRAAAGTLVANVLGCFVMGLLAQWIEVDAEHWSPRQLLLIRVGLLGSLTTFSTFAAEAWSVGGDGRLHWMLVHVGLHLVVGFAAFASGMWALKGWIG